MKFHRSLENLRSHFLYHLQVIGQSEDTLRTRSCSLDTFFKWLTDKKLTDVRAMSRDDVRNYHNWLNTQQLTINTIQIKLIGLRLFFNWLESTDQIFINPCEHMRLPKRGDRLPRSVLTQAESQKLLNAPDTDTPKGIRDKAILELFYSTGIRAEEMITLMVDDLDFTNGLLRVTRGKGAKDRVVPIGSQAKEWLTRYLEEVRSSWIAHQPEQSKLWLSAIGLHRPLSKQSLSVLMRNYKQKAGIHRAGRCHLWRHSCATHLVQNGVSLAHVQRLLGHALLDTTQIYTRVANREVQALNQSCHPRSHETASPFAAIQPRQLKGSYGNSRKLVTATVD